MSECSVCKEDIDECQYCCQRLPEDFLCFNTGQHHYCDEDCMMEDMRAGNTIMWARRAGSKKRKAKGVKA